MMNRRELLKILAASSAAAMLPGCLSWIFPKKTFPKTFTPHEKETMEALADTVLPNIDGNPGGIEAGAWEVFKDPFYHIRPWIQAAVSEVDRTAAIHYNKNDFKSCDLTTRTEILKIKLRFSILKKVYHTVVLMTKLAFFGGLVNSVGTDYIGFGDIGTRGKSDGYRPGPDQGGACKWVLVPQFK